MDALIVKEENQPVLKKEKSLNPEQKAAVETEGKTLLVSASAGTGKTYALCERILKHILDKGDISKLLVVTFTRAAAAEMRMRLSGLLKTACKNAPTQEEKSRLSEQEAALRSAKICTIDSFCYDVVKEHFDVLGISPGVKIADENTIFKAKERAMKKALEHAYTGKFQKKYEELADTLSYSSYHDSNYHKTLISIYEQVTLSLKGIDILKENAENLQKDSGLPFEEGTIGKQLLKEAESRLDFYIYEYEQALVAFENVKGKEKIFDLFSKEQAFFRKARALLKEKKVEELQRLASAFVDGTLRGCKFSEEELPYKLLRQEAVAAIKSPDKLFLNFNIKDCQQSNRRLADLHEMLYLLFFDYEKELTAYKEKYALLEFSDVEKMTYRLFKDSSFAKSVAEEYEEIYIDEYQDVTALQAAIFDSLTRHNAFMVGDVKQSIYGFRGACPTFFSERRGSYPPFDADAGEGAVYLKRNYRSTRDLLHFSNLISGKLLNCCKDMQYTVEDDFLLDGSDKGHLANICLIGKDYMTEEEYVAKSIRAMIDQGRKPEDILVLMKAVRTDGPKLKKALEEQQIRVDFNKKSDFFTQPEVLLLRSLLEMVSNPTKDVYLAGAMKSPVFGFTMEELLQLRVSEKEESLFGALQSYYGHTEDHRCKNVLSFISDFRQFAREKNVDEIVWKVLSECKLLSLLSFGEEGDRAEKIRENLLFFYDLSRNFSKNSSGNLGVFLSNLEDLEASDDPLSSGNNDPLKGYVRIMTIHGSKGLEAPVCWLYGFGKEMRFTRPGEQIVTEDYGVTMELKDETVPSFRSANAMGILNKKCQEDACLDEALRLFYVAVTRPEKELYISAVLSKADKEYLSSYEYLSEVKREHLFLKKKYIHYIFMAMGPNRQFAEIYEDALPFSEEKEGCLKKEHTAESPEDLKNCREELKKRMEFVYPYEASVRLPMKLSVSRLYPGILDEEKYGGMGETEFLSNETEKELQHEKIVPSFYSESHESSASERGTATHAFMQFCDFENLEKNGFEQEKNRLVEKNFLNAATASLVEEKDVLGFLRSPLYSEMKKAEKVYREQRFMVALPASDFSLNEEQKKMLSSEELLLQGVIDCFFISEKGETVLLDYKTDRNRGYSPEQFCKELIRRHSRQLSYYRKAIREMTGLTVSKTYVYSFDLNESVEIPFENDET